MDFKEYSAQLRVLRAEYANNIRKLANESDDYTIIWRSEHETSEYRLAVQRLISKYTEG